MQAPIVQNLWMLLSDWLLMSVNVPCNADRAAALHALGRAMDALSDCYAALSLDGSYLRAFQRRAEIFTALGDHACAAQVRSPAAITWHLPVRRHGCIAGWEIRQKKKALSRALWGPGPHAQLSKLA